MDRLTRERIEELSSRGLGLDKVEFQQLCDLALQSLSQEAVRDEALEEVAQMAQDRAASEHDDFSEFAHDVRALKREPNAAAAEGPAHGLPCWPVDGPAPAAPVAEMVMLKEIVPWLEAWGDDGFISKFSDGCPTPNAEKCLAFAARIRYALSAAEAEGRKS